MYRTLFQKSTQIFDKYLVDGRFQPFDPYNRISIFYQCYCCGLRSNRILLYFPFTVRPSVCHMHDISHFSHFISHICLISHIYKCHVNHQGTHQTLYILNQNHPCYLSSIDQTRQDHLLRPYQPDH